MWLTTHAQQHNPHKILIIVLQHDSVSEIGQKFKAEPASPNIIISQHPLNLKNLRSSDKTTCTFIRTKHIPLLVQNL
jgi:hypothetical protein